MRQHIAIAIAALMITSMAFAISTTSVSATHATPTISISPDFVKEGESYVFTLSVTNEGGDLIDTVEITSSSHLTNIEQIVKLPKDNIVENANVTLSDGTQVTVISASVTVAKDTVVSLPAGTPIVLPELGGDAELYEDGTAEMIASENSIATVSAVKAAADRLASLQNGDGGFAWILKEPAGASTTNTLGITAMGILKAHELEDKDTYEIALAKAYKYAVDKPPTYTWDGSKYTESTKGVDSFPDVTFLVWLAQAAANDDSLLAAIQGQVGGTAATDIAELAETRWDDRVLYLSSTQQTSPNGTATGMAEYIRDVRHGQGWDTLIPWDLEAAVKAALALNAYYPGQDYDAQAEDIADVIYASVDDGTHFSSTDNTQEGYVLGLTGAIEAFEEVGLYLENATALKNLLMDIQQPDGSWKYYGATPVEMSVQDTAYAVMALVAAGEGDAARLGACWLIDSQLENGGWYAEGGAGDEYLEIDSEAAWALVAQAPGPVPVTVAKQSVELSENDLRLLADTLAAASLWLPEDTPAEVPDDVDTNVAGDMTLVADDTVTLPDDSAADVRLLANTLILYTSGPNKDTIVSLVAGSEIDLRGSEDVVLPAGTTVTGTALVTVDENEDITIPAGTTVVLPTGTVSVPMPEGWSFTANEWSGDEDNIAVGETVEFPFAATVDGGSSWDIIVKTTDVKGYQALVVITLTSDGIPPSVTATVSPDPTNSAVTITVEASEELSKLGEVTVAQKDAADENVFEITMTSANGINWTGTYTVIPDHDGAAVVSIENSTDLVGNVGGENVSVATFEVDTIAPDAPRVGTVDLNDLPDFTEQPNQLVHGTAIDVAEVLVRVNADVTSVTPRADNGYSVAITLVEGPNEVGVSFADEAGNESEENVQDVFVDSLAPTVDMVSIAGKVYEENMPIDNNTPTIVVRMDDPGYPDTGSGIPYAKVYVKLLDENGGHIADLDNATPWENSGLWENAYPTELDDGAYIVAVSAQDEINDPTEENFTFVVDTVAPNLPDVPLSDLPIELVDERDHVIRGYAEADSTIKVYADDTVIKTGKADSSGYYRFTIRLPEGTNDIYVSATDAAGNESDRRLYGTVTVTITPVPPVDTVAPVVSITAPEAEVTTDEASIVIVGKVSELAEWTVSAPSGIQSGTTDSAGNFSASIALVDGTNTIIVTAVDAAGNPSAPVSIEVTRTVVPLEIYAIVLVILLVVLVAIAVLKR